jgi:hypothetical protein
VNGRERLTLEGVPADDAEIGRWLAAMEDARRDTLAEIEGIADDALDARPPGSENAIGTVLYHLALIEADWLVDDIFGERLGESDLAPLFPFDDRDEEGLLTGLAGVGLVEHLERLRHVRAVLLDRLRPMTIEDFMTPRARERYDVSPAWVLHHLLQHEAEHRSELGWLRRRLA